MEQIIGVFGILVILGAIIVVHEFGHFIVAKISGMLVHEFSIGFGPILFQWNKGGTAYSVRAVPLGGFVRIAGMEPNAEDEGDLAVKDNYEKKPFIAKFATIFAGAFMNFVLAFIVIIIMGTVIGFPKEGDTVIVGGVAMNQPAHRAGLKTGDEFVSIAGQQITDDDQVRPLIQKSKAPIAVVVKRKGELISVQVTPVPQMVPGKDVFVDTIKPESEIYDAGLRNGDRIISIAEQTVMNAAQADIFLKELTAPAPMVIIRDRAEQTLKVNKTDKDVEFRNSFLYRMFEYRGIGIVIATTNGQWEHSSPQEAITNGGIGVVNQLIDSVAQFASIVSGRIPVKAMSGPVGIMQGAYEASKSAVDNKLGLLNALNLVALFSIAIGFFNLLPIPALDGSRLVILTIEAIRRKPFDRNKEAIVHLVGLALLLAFVLYVTIFNDTANIFRR